MPGIGRTAPNKSVLPGLLDQRLQGQGAVTGGLTDFSAPADFFVLDHNQRHPLSTGFTVNLPARAYVSANVSYGSGFLNGDGSDHLQGLMTFAL
jgi:hypothetical protein